MEQLTPKELVKYWLDEFKKEQPHKYAQTSHYITNLHHWIAERVINNTPLLPPTR